MQNYNRYRTSSSSRKQPKRVSPVLIGISVMAFLTVTAYGLASVWQKAENAVVDPDKPSKVVTELTPTDRPEEIPGEQTGVADSSNLPEEEAPPLIKEPENTASSEPPETHEPVAGRTAYSYAAPDTGTLVDKSYFDDALFFGDSISVGIPLYGVIPNAEVIAIQGVNTININTQELVDIGDDTRVTMLEAAKQYGEKGKIYIMLGGNGLGFEKEPFIKGYREFIQSVKKAYPNAIIYIQSILPVTEDAHLNYPLVSNEKIDEYNLAIMELAQELKVPYLDVAAAMVDENGMLPTEASPADGVHLTGPYYFIWFDYLRSHTVEK